MLGLRFWSLAIVLLAISATISQAQGPGVVPGGWSGAVGHRSLEDGGLSSGFGHGYQSFDHGGMSYGGGPGWGMSRELTANQLFPIAGAFDREFRPRRRGR